MKKIVLAGFLAGSVLATSAFAYNGKCNQGSMMNCNMMNNTAFNCDGRQGNMNGSQRGFNKALFQLNLDDTQRVKIREIFQTQRNKMRGINEAFSSSSFDKNKFIEIVSSKRENMIKLKAQTIEDIYKLLTPKQKEQLKVLLDLKADRFKG